MKQRRFLKLIPILLALLCCWLPPALRASDLDSKFFPSNADTKAVLLSALTTAANSNRRLMVIYQGTWCTLCPELQKDIEGEKPGSLAAGYVVVPLKTEDLEGLQQFAQRLDPDLKLARENGPLITVFDKDGTLLDSLTTSRLMEDGRLSAARVNKRLVERWQLLPPASELFKAGLANVQSIGKTGIVEFGADWCKYCHLMDKFFDQSAASAVLTKYYLRIPIDYERNEGAPQLALRLGAKGDEGLPWWVMLDASGKPLANSRAPKGNIGFPTEEDERVYFMSVVQATAKGITSEELAVVNKALDEYMAKPGSK